MTDYITRYIDNVIIREHAYRSSDGYHLQTCDLPEQELASLTDLLLKKDEIMRDLILDRVQDLINQRIPVVEAQDHVSRGLKPVHDSQTGEVVWVKQNSMQVSL